MAHFDWQVLVRFRHCDPAGIVFYPRYFEMANDLVETFFAEAIGWSFSQMHASDRLGVPTGTISTRFSKPSRVGDILNWQLFLTRLGGASADLTMRATCGDEQRLEANSTIILADLDRLTSHPWPDAIRDKLTAYLKESPA